VYAFLTLATIIVTAFFLHRASTDQANALRISAIESVSQEVLKLGRWFADNPHLRVALALPEATDTADGEAAAVVYADFFDHVLFQEDVYNQVYMKAWRSYFEDRLRMYPQIGKFIKAHRSWYGPKLNALVP
jgi:hypothetical protein